MLKYLNYMQGESYDTLIYEYNGLKLIIAYV